MCFDSLKGFFFSCVKDGDRLKSNVLHFTIIRESFLKCSA